MGAVGRRVGVLSAMVGSAAAGIATGVAVERLFRRGERRPVDPYADELFGQQAYDESLMVPVDEGADVYVEIVDPVDGVDLELEDLRLNLAKPVDGAQPTLVFSHGFCLDMGTFYFQRKELTQRGDWRMVFYDQPGHGRSGRLATGEYDLGALGRSLRAVIDATVPDGPIVLVGHSMGGMAILALAEHDPDLFTERVAGVMLISTSAGRLEATRIGLPEIVARAGRPLLPLLDNATRLTGTMLDRARLASSNIAWLLTRKYGFGPLTPSRALVSFVERMNSRTSTETVARYLRTLYTHARYPALEVLRDIPVLLVCGDKDYITPLSLSEEINRRLPDAELVVVPDSGHVVLLEHSDIVTQALIEFVEKVR